MRYTDNPTNNIGAGIRQQLQVFPPSGDQAGYGINSKNQKLQKAFEQEVTERTEMLSCP